MWLAAIYLGIAAITLLATGGFSAHVLGIPLSLHSLRKPALVSIALVAIWILASQDGLRRATGWLDRLSRASSVVVVSSIALVAATAISLVKIDQHRILQTSAYDLGIHASVAWNTARGWLFHDSIQNLNYLGDHFSPIHLVLAVPFLLWDSPEILLVVQSIGFAVAAIAVYRITARRLESRSLALFMMLLFLLNPYLHEISAFDFHPAALASAVFLWLLDALERGMHRLVIALSVVAATIEETLVPPLVGIGVYAMLFEAPARRLGLGIAVAALAFFILETQVLMPYFLGHDLLTHIPRYENLGGDSLGEIGLSIARDPLLVVREMTTPGEKVGALVALFSSVGFLPLLAPAQLLLLAIPVVAVQLSSMESQWQLFLQYSATILPFLFFAAIHGIERLRDLTSRATERRATTESGARKLGGVLAALLLAFAVRGFPEYRRPWSAEKVAASHELLRQIPPEATVCATQNLVPHLVDRHLVSMFRPVLGDGLGGAKYVLLNSDPTPHEAWPFQLEEYALALERVRRRADYRLVREQEGILLFERHAAR